jgi:hypothetical protein
MTEDAARFEGDRDYLRKAVHDLNNSVGVILTSSELLQLDLVDDRSKSRCGLIEQKALEARQILAEISHRCFDEASNS